MIDIVSQICVFNDNPIWRAHIKKYRSKFNKVILYPSRHHGVIDLEEFWRKVFPETWVTGHTIDWTMPGIDWRQAETEPCLELSDADWILFTEADFFVDNWDKLLIDIEAAMQTSDIIGWYNQTAFPYIHPCFLLVKRELLEDTKKDFRAHPEIDGSDHFSMITHDALRVGAKLTKLQDLGWIDWENAYHGGGFTYPYQNWKGDGTDIFGVASPEAFMVYNYFSRKAQVEQSPLYANLSLEIENRLKTFFPILKLDNNRWTKFYA